jgi:hypothetical protein
MLIVAHATDPVPDLVKTGITVPDDFAAVIMKCLAKKPKDRFDTPRDLLLALEQCDAGNEWTWEHAEDRGLTHIPTHREETSVNAESYSQINGLERSVAPAVNPLDRTLIVDRELVSAATPAC